MSTTTTTVAPTTTTTPAPTIIGTKNLGGDLNVIDFKISKIDEPILSADFKQITLAFTGIANPENTDVELVAYEYSTDNGITWSTMTTESSLTGLTFSTTGTVNNLVWDIKEDLSTIYNVTIKIRFRAQATFDSKVILTDYKVRSIYLSKIIVQNSPVKESVFPPEYSGTPGSSLMKNRPK